MIVSERFLQWRALSSIVRRIDCSSDAPKRTRVHVAIWSALLAFAVFVSLRDYQSFQVGTYIDDSNYVALAQSLVHSDTYGPINMPEEQPAVGTFPPGYPLLLAPIVLLFPGNLDALKALSLFATLVSASMLFWGWRWLSRRSYWWALAIVGLYILSPLTVGHTRMVMAEAVFTTFCLATIILAEQAARGQQNHLWILIILGVTLTFVLLTRTIGVVLIISVFAYLVSARGKESWRDLLVIVATMITLGGLILGATSVEPRNLVPARYLKERNAAFIVGVGSAMTRSDPGDQISPEYLVEVSQTGERSPDTNTLLKDFLVAGATWHLGVDFRLAILPIGGGAREQAVADRLGIPNLIFLVGYLISGLLFLGILRWIAQEGLSAFNLFAVVYLGALFFWTWTGSRLLYPIQSHLHYGFLVGVEAVLFWAIPPRNQAATPQRLKKGMLVAVVVFLVLASTYKSLRIGDSRLHVGDLQVRSSWIRSNTPKYATVMTEQPLTDYLYSNRKTVPYPSSPSSDDELKSYLGQRGIDYVLIGPRLAWAEDRYTPTYSDQTLEILLLLEDLAAQEQVTLVYASDADLIKVFRVAAER